MCFQNSVGSLLFSMAIGKDIDEPGSIFLPHKNDEKQQNFLILSDDTT